MDQNSFVWGFNTWSSNQLPECQRLQIFVGGLQDGDQQSKPPYTLIAYETGGLATRQLVGNDLNNLWWTVDHAKGAQLVLSMADADGNAGGVSQDLYTVVAGPTTTCHDPNPTSPVSLITNTTKTLQSCDTLPLKITGGTRPYTITVAALGSKTVTNVTMGPAFDTFNWVNRAAPNGKILASVSDANGLYAPSTNLLTTFGSTDLTCGGLLSAEIDSTGKVNPSSPGGSAATATAGGSASTATKAKDKAGDGNDSKGNSGGGTSLATIVGGAAAGAILLGLVLLGMLFYFRRRKRRATRPYGLSAAAAVSSGAFGSGPMGGHKYGEGYGDEPYSGFGLGQMGGQGSVGSSYVGIPTQYPQQGYAGYAGGAGGYPGYAQDNVPTSPYYDGPGPFAGGSPVGSVSDGNRPYAPHSPTTAGSPAMNLPPGAAPAMSAGAGMAVGMGVVAAGARARQGSATFDPFGDYSAVGGGEVASPVSPHSMSNVNANPNLLSPTTSTYTGYTTTGAASSRTGTAYRESTQSGLSSERSGAVVSSSSSSSGGPGLGIVKSPLVVANPTRDSLLQEEVAWRDEKRDPLLQGGVGGAGEGSGGEGSGSGEGQQKTGVYQHADSEDTVVELPPAYKERSDV